MRNHHKLLRSAQVHHVRVRLLRLRGRRLSGILRGIKTILPIFSVMRPSNSKSYFVAVLMTPAVEHWTIGLEIIFRFVGSTGQIFWQHERNFNSSLKVNTSGRALNNCSLGDWFGNLQYPQKSGCSKYSLSPGPSPIKSINYAML